MRTLNSVAGSDTEVKIIAVIVKADNAAASIEETKGYRFGVYEGSDREQIDETIETVKQANTDTELIGENYGSPLEMAQALLDGKIDAAICNKAYMEILNEVIVDFPSKSRIIYEKEYEMATADASGGFGAGDAAGGKAKERTSLTEEPYTILISGIDVSFITSREHNARSSR